MDFGFNQIRMLEKYHNRCEIRTRGSAVEEKPQVVDLPRYAYALLVRRALIKRTQQLLRRTTVV